MDRLVFGALDVVLVLLLTGMFFMVFGNVVLRYGFNSGIVFSEEMSRIFFVWLTFLGAVVTFRDRAHVGVDSLVIRFPPRGRLICRIAADIVILGCCAAFFWGSWMQAGINATMRSPVTSLPLIYINGVGFVTSLGIAAITLARLISILTGRMSDAERAVLYGRPDENAPPRTLPGAE